LGTPGTFRRLRKVSVQQVYPAWFHRWPEAEEQAQTLRWYEPLVIPGLLQTDDYARAVLRGQPDATEEKSQRRSAHGYCARKCCLRTTRQTCGVVDEGVLHRCIGDRGIRQEQLAHLCHMAERSRISVQVIPAETGAHAGLLAHFAIAEVNGQRDTVYLETATVGQVIEMPAIIAQASVVFDTLRSLALTGGASLDLIMKVAETEWMTAD
jgi:hypothetical protein